METKTCVNCASNKPEDASHYQLDKIKFICQKINISFRDQRMCLLCLTDMSGVLAIRAIHVVNRKKFCQIDFLYYGDDLLSYHV